MEHEEYEIMFRAEDRHWWYLGMAAITRGVLDKYVGRERELRILDAGCGTGGTLGYLADYGAAVGIDSSSEALRLCHARGLERIGQASITELPFPDESFDLVTSFDVMSEAGPVMDEEGLREFMRVLSPGGYLLLRLPAYGWLHGGQHDERVHTRKRYSRRLLTRLLSRHGFEPVKLSYANAVLFPLALAKRVGERIFKPRRQGSDLTISTGLVNRVFTTVLRFEAPLVRGPGLPFGLTLVGLARKPA